MSVAVPTDDPTPREVVGRYLAEQCQVITAADAALRQRVDPVHDTRVAIRRLRSTLRVFGPIFDPSAAAALSTELTWYAALLGAVRNREVLRARLGDAVADLSSGLVLGPVGERIDRHLESELTYHHEELTRAMRSDRYRALLTSLTEWTEAPPYTTTVDDPQGLVRMADKAAHKAKRRLTEAHTVNDTATALHRARKSAKRARYSAEVVEPLGAEKAAKRIRHFRHIQTALGDYQDSVIAADVLRLLGAGAGTLPGHNGFTYGVLYDREIRAGEVARQEAADL